VRRALKGRASRLQFLDDRMLRLAERCAKPYEWISGWKLERTLAVLKPVYGLMKGIPTDHPLFSTYWRKKTPPPVQMDPDRDGCGLLWCSPVAPNRGSDALAVADVATRVTLTHGFEPQISMTTITDRALACIISLGYDRETPGEDGRAMACYHELLTRLAAEGYHPYRLSLGAMNAMRDGTDYCRLLETLKRTLDPREILSPGRYVSVQPAVRTNKCNF